jgi:carbonic anhydrase
VYELLSMPPKALLIACSDDRFPFISHAEIDLGLSEGYYFPIRIAGGPIPMAYPAERPDDYDFLVRQVRFILKHRPTISEVIALCHAECGYVGEFLPQFTENGREDLQVIAKEIRSLFPQIKHVKLFYAHLEGGKIDFQRVAEYESLQPA